MNKARRAKLETLSELITEAKVTLEEIRDEEQEYYDNMPKVIQESDKGADVETCLEALDSAVDSLGDAADSIFEAIN